MRRSVLFVLALAVTAVVPFPAAAATDARATDQPQVGLLRARDAAKPAKASTKPGKRSRSSHKSRLRRKDVLVLGHVDPGRGFNADVVAHRGFAYLASWGAFEDTETGLDFCPSLGVRVYSLHRPRHPVRVATFASGRKLDGSWTEKVIVRHVNTRAFTGDVAAVSIQSCSERGFTGFGLWDVTDPTHPRRLALYETPNAGGSHEIWLAAPGNRAYVYTAVIFSELTTSPDFDPDTFSAMTPGEPDFRIIDVSDPRNPVKVGEWGAWAELGVDPTTGQGNEFAASFVHSVITNRTATRAYLSYWDLGTVILDISDPAHPRFLGRTRYPSEAEGNAHSTWLAKGGRILIQTDEDFDPEPGEGTEAGWGFARFFDVKDPANPVQIGTLALPTTRRLPAPLGFFSVHDPKVRGSRAYFSWYSEGVVVAKISRPATPRVIAQFVPPATADPMGYFGPYFLDLPPSENPAFPFVWGVFPYRNYVLASDINSGLWVLKVR
ncbi:MAG: hypothetical protein M3327_11870 [Actinomycetota bacterium]|nr:hypothetical protein [Actinomycetota bacterium]